MTARLAAVLVVAFLLAACGGPAPSRPGPTSTPVASPSTVSVPSASPAASPAPSASISAVPPTPAPAPAGVERFEVPEASNQVLLVTAGSWDTSHAALTALERTDDGWTPVLEVPARLGSRGLVVAQQREQGSRTTPAGMFPLTSAFGREEDPGTALPYTVVGPDHWWVGESTSPHYNEMRLASQGGFTTAAPNEHLVEYDPQYDHAVVIDFNRPDAVPGRGAAIFLHVNGSGATAGCVSIPEPELERVLQWLDPAQSPVTVIGPSDWLGNR